MLCDSGKFQFSQTVLHFFQQAEESEPWKNFFQSSDRENICVDGTEFEEWGQAKFIPGFLFCFPFLFSEEKVYY